MWREWRFQSIWALEAKSSQQCSWAARQAGWALDQVDPQLDQLPGKLEGSWRVTTECCQSLPMIARRCGKFSQMDGFPATTLTCCCQEIPPCALGRKINGLGTLVQTFCLWKADGKSFPSAQPLNGDLFGLFSPGYYASPGTLKKSTFLESLLPPSLRSVVYGPIIHPLLAGASLTKLSISELPLGRHNPTHSLHWAIPHQRRCWISQVSAIAFGEISVRVTWPIQPPP